MHFPNLLQEQAALGDRKILPNTIGVIAWPTMPKPPAATSAHRIALQFLRLMPALLTAS